MLKVNKRTIIVGVIVIALIAIGVFWQLFSPTRALVRVTRHQVDAAKRELEVAYEHWEDVQRRVDAAREEALAATQQVKSAARKVDTAARKKEAARRERSRGPAYYMTYSERIRAIRAATDRALAAIRELRDAKLLLAELQFVEKLRLSALAIAESEANDLAQLCEEKEKVLAEKRAILKELEARAGAEDIRFVILIGFTLIVGIGILWYRGRQTRNAKGV